MRADSLVHRVRGRVGARTPDVRTSLILVPNDHLDRSTYMQLLHEALARARMREMREPRVSRGARRSARQVAAEAARLRDRV